VPRQFWAPGIVAKNGGWRDYDGRSTMIIRKPLQLRYSDVSPKAVYLNRRRFLSAALASPALALAGAKLNVALKSPFSTTEKPTPLDGITHYNNSSSQEAFFSTACVQMVSLSIRPLKHLWLTPLTLKRREGQPTWPCLISTEQQGWARRT
jgi:hypothetical protein